MTTSTQVGLAGLPRVNLLPPEIAERRRFRRTQYGLGSAVLVAIGAVLGLLYLASASQHQAQSRLDAATAEHTRVQKEVTSYANVKDVYGQVSARETMLTTAMGGEVQWSRYLNDLSLSVPDNVWVTNLDAKGPAVGAPQAPATAGTAAGIGTITAAGTAFAHDDVANWLESLAKEKGYANPYFSNSAEAAIGSKKVVNFSSTVTVTPDALSGRFTKPAGS